MVEYRESAIARIRGWLAEGYLNLEVLHIRRMVPVTPDWHSHLFSGVFGLAVRPSSRRLLRFSPKLATYHMAFSNAANFRIDQSTFNDAQGNINYCIRNNRNRTYNHTVQGDQHIHIHGGQDIRGCVHLAMENHINTDAFHDSGARRDPSRCYPGTREAALETISHWVRHPSSYCLWLHGPAGTGKSAIAQTFAEKCHQDRTLGATYFFTRGSTSGPPRGPPPIFSTLAYQLMSVFPHLDEHLWAVIHADRTIFKRSLSAQLDRLIVQPFLRLVNKSTSAVVIIDGLDECDRDSIQGEIVRLILSLEQYSLPLLFLISSRPEPEIRRAFESSPGSSLLHLPLDKTMHPDRDIRHFLRKEFERIYVEMDMMPPVTQLPWPSTEDIEKLVRKSSGHFIYAATVIRFVQEDHAHPMDRLYAILNIPSESTNSSAAMNIFADSVAFQELDGLYLHILRKFRNRTELAKILRAIMHFGGNTLAGDIEAIFDLRPGSVRILLKGLRSIVDVPADDTMPLRFLHASFNDFLADPERSTREFHLETSYFNAELAREYMRLIVTFSPSKSGYSLAMAIDGLRDCLRATADLFFNTLRKLINMVTQKLESIPPCLLYVILDFLLRNVLNELPGAEAARERCEIILQWLEPQLVELSDKIFTILRVLGARAVAGYGSTPPVPLEEVGQLISVLDGGLIFQQILNLNHHDLSVDSSSRWRWKPFGQIYKSLYHWFLPRHRPKKQRPSYVAVDRYTWVWAWDTYGSHYPPDPSGVDFVHYVDLVYGCLQLVLLEFSQPLSLTPPLIREALERTPGLLTRACFNYRVEHWPDFNFLELIEAIDFTSVLQGLPDITTTFCPRLFYLHSGLDVLYCHIQADRHPVGSYRPIPHYQEFLETIYSRLLQDLLASRVIPIVYAMFEGLPYQTVAFFLSNLASGELNRSAAMQGLFGVNFWEEDERSMVSNSLGVLLRMGRVKLRLGQDNESEHIDDCMGDAHEYLAFCCMEYPSCTNLEGKDKQDEVARQAEYLGAQYADEYWRAHLERARPSKRLFEMLRRVDISSRDIKLVIRWLEMNPNAPEDVLARWHAAKLDFGTKPDSPPPSKPLVCLLDEVFEGYCRKRQKFRVGNHGDSESETDGESDWEF